MSGTQILKGLTIILFGVILLLNNLNILEWSVWYNIFRLWPVLLISLGIGLIFRRRLSWLAPMVILVGIIFGVSAGQMGIDLNLESKIATEVVTLQREVEMIPVTKEIEQAPEQDTTTEEMIADSTAEIRDENTKTDEEIIVEETEIVPRVQKASLHINYDVGVFVLEFPTPLVYQCQISYRYPEFKPIEDYSISDHEANIYIHHNPVSVSGEQFRNPRNHIDLKLNKEVIYDILIETGATTIDYDFSKFKVEKISINSGASDINIIAPQYNGDINIDSGVSKIDIAIPSNVGAIVNLDTGLSMKDIDENFQKQENDVYISKNYSASEYQVNINIDAGLSQISIHYM